jgi:hypothetical protein
MKRKAEPGTVSHGTLRLPDLLDALSRTLRGLSDEPRDQFLAGQADAWSRALELCPDMDTDGVAEDVLDHMDDALQGHAPAGHYFGAHEGDGSDLGFWRLSEEDDMTLETPEQG